MSSRTTSCSYTTLVLVTIYPQGGWALYTSSGRMSSRTTGCSSITLALVTTYPQGLWAHYISSVRMSLSTKFWFSLLYGGCFHNTLRKDELITYPQWALQNFITIISSWRISSLHILREDELGNQFLSSYWSICTHCIIGIDQIKRTIWGSPI